MAGLFALLAGCGGDDVGGGGSTSSSDATSTGAELMPLRVVAFNVLHGFPDFEQLDERTQILADYINAEQPDVLALQEIAQSPALTNRAELLAGLTGYEYVWEPASGLPAVFEEGPGVLSRWPIVWSESLELPHPGDGGFERRRIIGAHIQSPQGLVAVFSAHLTTQNDETIKADQAAAAYEFVTANSTDLPTIVAGDMNAEPDTLAMRFLRGESEHQGTRGALVDSWLETNPDDVGFTAPADAPDHRIDYVFRTQDISSTEGCALVFTEPVASILASDHLGVACELTL